MDPVIELDGLEVRFGGRPILVGLAGSLAGRSIGLLGPNGAGKTTLLHTLLGFHPPFRGTARVFGLDIRERRREILALTGYMPENESFIADLSAVRFVRLMAELSGLPPANALERAHEVLWYVGLGEARYRKMGTFSAGMKQKVKLAQAIAHAPRLLFLDEPTNGLDPAGRERMIRLIREIRDSGQVRLILSSHILRDVEECCEEVIVLKEGRIAATCNLEEERRAHRGFLELETSGQDGRLTEELTRRGWPFTRGAGRRIKLVLPEGSAVQDLYRIAATLGVPLRRLNHKRDSLEEIFLKAMEGDDGGL